MTPEELDDLVPGYRYGGAVELLVDPSDYTGSQGLVWCPLEHVALGSAAVYPYKVEIPNGATGQYAAHEIRERRGSIEHHGQMGVEYHKAYELARGRPCPTCEVSP